MRGKAQHRRRNHDRAQPASTGHHRTHRHRALGVPRHPSTAFAQNGYRIDTNGGDLRVRTSPGGEFKRWIADETPVDIRCQQKGPSVEGKYGTSRVWNKIGRDEYVP